MLKDISELKEFLLWAKGNGLVSIKVDSMEFVFGPENQLPEEAKKMVKDYWVGMTGDKVNDMSLDNPLLFDAVR